MPIWLGRTPPTAHLNVTPLVDVVLVLLIVFMVTAPLAEEELLMRLPERAASAAPAGDRPEETVLTVKSNGRVVLGGQETSVDDAMRRIRTEFAGHPSRVLFFDAEDAVSYQEAVDVLDRARRSGVDTIAMMTDAPPPAAR